MAENFLDDKQIKKELTQNVKNLDSKYASEISNIISMISNNKVAYDKLVFD